MTKKDSGVGRQKYSNVVCENIVIVVLNDVRFDIISILLKTKQITLNSVLWNLVTLD